MKSESFIQISHMPPPLGPCTSFVDQLLALDVNVQYLMLTIGNYVPATAVEAGLFQKSGLI